MIDEGFAPPEKIRRFDQDVELLPLKINGRLVRRFKPKLPDVKDEVKEEAASITSEKPPKLKEDPIPQLSVHELLVKQKFLLKEAKIEIASLSDLLISDPQENVGQLKELLKFCAGEEVEDLVRHTIRKLAIASLTEVFISIIPGYQIRMLTLEEQKQKMKADTRKVLQSEHSLLTNYQKYLFVLEENAMKLVKCTQGDKEDLNKIAILSIRCMCKLLNRVSHFNYSSNIVSCLIRIAASSNEEVILEVCNALSETFKEDMLLNISLHAVKAISEIVNTKKGHVSPLLLSVFLSLNIRHINKPTAPKEKLKPKPIVGRMSKQMRKQNKRNKKVEDPLREAEAAVKLHTKSKIATEIMKYVFMTYFRILKRMPSTLILGPVLEGLTKFAHLVNVEFFEDLVHSLSLLVDQKHLKLIDSLRCIKTVCVILSGEGQVLNIDPLKFYNILYALIPNILFQEDSALNDQVAMLVDCLEMLIIKRRKLISLKRVAAFVKRVLLVCILLPTKYCVSLLSVIRCIFVSHPGLCILVDEDGEEEIANGVFQPDSTDPDCSNSLSTDLVSELKLLSQHSDEVVKAFSKNILSRTRLAAQWTNMTPKEWLNNSTEYSCHKESPFKQRIKQFCGEKKIAMTSKNACSTVLLYLQRCKN